MASKQPAVVTSKDFNIKEPQTSNTTKILQMTRLPIHYYTDIQLTSKYSQHWYLIMSTAEGL
jgi:hypothetical protein